MGVPGEQGPDQHPRQAWQVPTAGLPHGRGRYRGGDRALQAGCVLTSDKRDMCHIHLFVTRRGPGHRRRGRPRRPRGRYTLL